MQSAETNTNSETSSSQFIRIAQNTTTKAVTEGKQQKDGRVNSSEKTADIKLATQTY